MCHVQYVRHGVSLAGGLFNWKIPLGKNETPEASVYYKFEVRNPSVSISSTTSHPLPHLSSSQLLIVSTSYFSHIRISTISDPSTLVLYQSDELLSWPSLYSGIKHPHIQQLFDVREYGGWRGVRTHSITTSYPSCGTHTRYLHPNVPSSAWGRYTPVGQTEEPRSLTDGFSPSEWS